MALVAYAKYQDVFVSLTYDHGRHSCRNLSPKDYGGGAIHKGRGATEYYLLSHTINYQLITTPKHPFNTALTFAIMDSTRVTLDELDLFTNPDRFVGKLNGKVAVVTGTSAGIGRSIAKAFAGAGAQVACIARRQADLDSLITEIGSTGGRAFAIAADVAQPGAATKIVTEVEQKFGPVDILINNAGISRISPLVSEDPSIDIWWRIYEVNVRAPVALIRAVLPSMIERGSGAVMTTSSQVASMALPVMTAYASSKAAISKFHESIVPELEGTGVFSYAINPGMVATELGKPEHAINKEAINHPAMQAFIGSVGGARKLQKPESCANMMLTLAADERCKVLNGRHLNADQEMEPVLLEAEKEGKGRLGKEKLYLVNIGEL